MILGAHLVRLWNQGFPRARARAPQARARKPLLPFSGAPFSRARPFSIPSLGRDLAVKNF
jgi:hypothetical protein